MGRKLSKYTSSGKLKMDPLEKLHRANADLSPFRRKAKSYQTLTSFDNSMAKKLGPVENSIEGHDGEGMQHI